MDPTNMPNTLINQRHLTKNPFEGTSKALYVISVDYASFLPHNPPYLLIIYAKSLFKNSLNDLPLFFGSEQNEYITKIQYIQHATYN